MPLRALLALFVLGCGARPAPSAAPVVAPEDLVWVRMPTLFERSATSMSTDVAYERPLIDILVEGYLQHGARRMRLESRLLPMTPCPIGIPQSALNEVQQIAYGDEPILSAAPSFRAWHAYTDAIVSALVAAGIERGQIEVAYDPRVEVGLPEAPFLHAHIEVVVQVRRPPSAQ